MSGQPVSAFSHATMLSAGFALLAMAFGGAALLQTQGEVSGVEELLQVFGGLDSRMARRIERVWLSTCLFFPLLSLSQCAWLIRRQQNRNQVGSGGFDLDSLLLRLASVSSVAVALWQIASVAAPATPRFLTLGAASTLVVGLMGCVSYRGRVVTGKGDGSQLVLIVITIELLCFASLFGVSSPTYDADFFSGWRTVLDGHMWAPVLVLASIAALQVCIMRLCLQRAWHQAGFFAGPILCAAGLAIIVWFSSRIEADVVWKICKFLPFGAVWAVGFARAWATTRSWQNAAARKPQN